MCGLFGFLYKDKRWDFDLTARIKEVLLIGDRLKAAIG